MTPRRWTAVPLPRIPVPQRLNWYPRTDGPMPPRAKYVGRPSRFGNPFTITRVGQRFAVLGLPKTCETEETAHVVAVALYREWVEASTDAKAQRIRAELSQLKEYEWLACRCSLELECHVDVLLERLARLPR